jgi:hypothetical protein
MRVDIIGINPPEDVTPCTTLNAGEERAGIGLWRHDLYGVGSELMDKRRKRGWDGDEEESVLREYLGVFPETNDDEQERGVLERLLLWDGNGRNELFPDRENLPWNR